MVGTAYEPCGLVEYNKSINVWCSARAVKARDWLAQRPLIVDRRCNGAAHLSLLSQSPLHSPASIAARGISTT